MERIFHSSRYSLHLLFQVQDDVGAARLLFALLDGVAAVAGRFPAGSRSPCLPPLAGDERDPVGHHEGGVEADAELADQLRVVLDGFLLQALHEGAGAGAGDGADVLLHLGDRHADAVVADGEGAGPLVGDDLDLPVAVPLQKRFAGVGFEADLVDGVGGVGDQFPQEDVLVGVEGMDDEVEQLLDLGLELFGGFGHAAGSPLVSWMIFLEENNFVNARILFNSDKVSECSEHNQQACVFQGGRGTKFVPLREILFSEFLADRLDHVIGIIDGGINEIGMFSSAMEPAADLHVRRRDGAADDIDALAG